MRFVQRAFARLSLVLLAFAAVCAVTAPAQAAKFYVDNKLGELKPEDRVKIAEPRPVQLLFQFSTDGAPNAKATKYLKTQVLALVKASGLFSEVSELPVAGGATLAITFNNITEKGAAGKGFTAGLTFGLAGTLVVDNYLVTAEYQAGSSATPIKASVEHKLYTKIGAKDPPPDATEFKKPADAIAAIARQSIDHALNKVASDAAFAAAPAPAPEAAKPNG